MPAYTNAEEDWDQENWIPLSLPTIPSFLTLSAIALTGTLLTAAYVFRKDRRDKDSYSVIQTNDTPTPGMSLVGADTKNGYNHI